jgi:hypothetical protein
VRRLHARLRASRTCLSIGCPWEVQVVPSEGDERARRDAGSRRQVSHRSLPSRPLPDCWILPFAYLRTFQVSRLFPRAQVSADYSPGSCESDSVVVVTASKQRGQNSSLCAVKFLITVRRSVQSYGLLLIRHHYYTVTFGILISRALATPGLCLSSRRDKLDSAAAVVPCRQ